MQDRFIPEPGDQVMQPEYWQGHSFSDRCRMETFKDIKRAYSTMTSGFKVDDYYRRIDQKAASRLTLVESFDPDRYPTGTIIIVAREMISLDRGQVEYANQDLNWGVVAGKKDSEHFIVLFPYGERARPNTSAVYPEIYEEPISAGYLHHRRGAPLIKPDVISIVKGIKLCEIGHPGQRRRLPDFRLWRNLGRVGQSHINPNI